jgi:hypothetical protein
MDIIKPHSYLGSMRREKESLALVWSNENRKADKYRLTSQLL